MRAARDRADLTQEEVAERMNVSIHTFRPWDRGTRKPARLEQRKLLALIVGTPVEVIWPSERDPQVAEALRRETQRAASRVPRGEAHQTNAVREPDVGRAASPRVHEADAHGRDDSLTNSSESRGDEERAPAVERQPGKATETASDPGLVPPPEDDEGVAREAPDGLPPWPVDPLVDDSEDDRAAAFGSEDHRPENSSCVGEADGLESERAPESDGAVATLTPASRRPRRATHAVLAAGVAIVLGGAGLIAANAVNDGAADAEPSARTRTNPEAAAERERAMVRARWLADMRGQAARGNYDAAIVAARAVGDSGAVERYRQAAASVLVRRANAAAGRGDLSLARKRLRLAAKKYGATAGALDVQRRIRRIERARADRAKRRRAAARQQVEASSASVPAPSAGSEGAQPSATAATKSPDAGSSGANGSSSSITTSGSGAGSSSSSSSSGSGMSKCDDGCGLGAFP